MSWPRVFAARLRGLFIRNRAECELENEVSFHLEMLIEDNLRAGMKPAEARRAAMRSFGGVEVMKETYRELRTFGSIESLARDFRYALRAMHKSPGFTMVVVICLALGIGANTAIFSLIDAALLRMLPVAQPERLVIMRSVTQRGRQAITFSYPAYAYLRAHTRSAEIFAYDRIALNLSAGGFTDAPSGELVSDNFFAVLGVRPVIGRAIAPKDEATAVISYRYWQSRFHGDPEMVGRTLALNGLPFTVIGIAPPEFFGVEVGSSPDVYVPLTMCDRLSPGPPRLELSNSFWLQTMARLAPGATPTQAKAEMDVIYYQSLTDQVRSLRPGTLDFLRKRQIEIAEGAKGQSRLRRDFGTPLVVLMTVVGLVLLIACANVANLLLSRAAVRRKEIAVRLALGAGRARLMRQFLTESITLSIAGGLLGLLFANWSAGALSGFLSKSFLDVAPNAHVFAFTLAISLLTGLIFGCAPALQATRPDVIPALKNETAVATSGKLLTLGRLLVVGQVAISMLLLIGAGLFIRTLANLRNVDMGFRTGQILLVSLNPGLSRYTPERTLAFYDQLLDKVRALPGVGSAALADMPLLGGAHVDGLSVEGHTARQGEDLGVSVKTVSPRFFETMGIPLHLGRDFSELDRISAQKVAIINESIAREFFDGGNPIGRHIGLGGPTDMEIVGVIADTKYNGIRDPIPNTIYLPAGQGETLSAARTLHVSALTDSANLAAAVRHEIQALDPNLPAKIVRFSDLVDERLVQERLVATLSGFFGALALLLAAVGLYGVMAYAVQRRTREIGIRMSMGAERSQVLWMVAREAFGLIIAGVVLGLPVALAASRLVSSMLFGLTVTDPSTIVAATLLLLIAGQLAAFLPAYRASRVDPMVALRYE
ncbi:MAG TPA: ABC transporter permease [Bryobacteraceae bacterium]|nr:ABC transporter permease [Bryobacteraceae bacterium]